MPPQAVASAASFSRSLFLCVLVLSFSLLARGVIVWTGRLLPPPLFDSAANRNWGVASFTSCNSPRAGANKQASAPVRCQPSTISDSASWSPSGVMPKGALAFGRLLSVADDHDLAR